MGDENSTLSEAEARHLLRRTGFDVPEKTVKRWMSAGITRGEAADQLLKFKPQGFKPNGGSWEAIHDKWVKFMLKAKSPLQEKLVLFWHDHFATGIAKVQEPKLMTRQNTLFRRSCKGNFKDLVKQVNGDPAMMEYLDTVRNRKDGINENYARELQELFTLGTKDVNGADNYVQEDIVQIARAFTGWRYDDDGTTRFSASRHDFGGAPKVIYKQTGQFGPDGVNYAANGEGPMETSAIVDIIFQHRDTDGHNTVARRMARRFIEFFGTPDPTLAFVDDVVGTGPTAFDANWLVSDLLRRLFTHDDFYLGVGAPGVTPHKSVAWPVDFAIATLRRLKVKPKGRDLRIAGGEFMALRDHLVDMGQTLFDPPSVFGWEWETGWVSSATMLARYRFARDLVRADQGGGTSFRPDKLVDLGLTDPEAVVDAVLTACGVQGMFDAAEKAALVTYYLAGADPEDLADIDFRRGKVVGLFALVLQSPAYQLI